MGTLPTLAHGVGGTLQFLSTSQLKLRGFSYDGAGPGEGVGRARRGLVLYSSIINSVLLHADKRNTCN